MSRIEFFKKGYAAVGVKLGIISPRMITYYDHYKAFIKNLNEGMSEKEAIQTVEDDFECSYSTAYRSVQFFRG